MKKIAFVCESLSYGGMERVINVLSSNLIENYNIDIIVTTDTKPSSYNNDNRIKSIYLNSNKSKFKLFNKVNKIFSLKKYIENSDYDLFICFGFKVCMSMLLNKKYKNKIVISERTDPDSYCSKFIKKIRNILYKRAKMMICQTEYVKNYYENVGLKNCVVIPNPIKDNLPKRFENERRHVVVNFCRLNPQKNLKLLIDSFEIFHKSFNDYRLIIYGEGELEKELKEYIVIKKLEDYV